MVVYLSINNYVSFINFYCYIRLIDFGLYIYKKKKNKEINSLFLGKRMPWMREKYCKFCGKYLKIVFHLPGNYSKPIKYFNYSENLKIGKK